MDNLIEVEIEVKLYAILRRYRPDNAGGAMHHPFAVTLPEGSAAAALVAHLQIPDKLVAAIACNEASADWDTILHDGDKVALFPPTAGG